MDIRWIISPIVGSAIGYLTNWLAIRMLFRPHRQLRFLGMALPFTPGLIPKERGRLAELIGRTVGSELMTADMIASALTKESVVDRIAQGICAAADSMRCSDSTLGECLSSIAPNGPESLCKADVAQAFLGLIDQDCLQAAITSSVRDRLDALRVSDASLKELIPGRIMEAIDKAAETAGPELALYLARQASSEEGRRMVRKAMEQMIPVWTQVFIPVDAIADKLSEYLSNRLSEPNTGWAVSKELSRAVKGLGEMKVSALLSRVDASFVDALVQGVSDEMGASGGLSRMLDVRLSAIACLLSPQGVKAAASLVADQWVYLVNSYTAPALNALNIPEIVRTRIDSLDLTEVEGLVQQVAGRELLSITRLGALIGFLMGLITPTINLFLK